MEALDASSLVSSSSQQLPNLQPHLDSGIKERILSVFRSFIPVLNAKISSTSKMHQQLTCPISQEPIVKLAAISCGHAFDEENIEQWQSRNSNCPDCRKEISNTIPVFQVQTLIDQWQKKERIPTLSHFTENKPEVAKLYLVRAQNCIVEGKDKEAVRCFAMAFKYTNDSQAYRAVPEYFEQIGDKEKASLGCLHLAQQLIEEDKTEEAIAVLEKYKALKPNTHDVDDLLIILYTAVSQTAKAASLTALKAQREVDLEQQRVPIRLVIAQLRQECSSENLHTLQGSLRTLNETIISVNGTDVGEHFKAEFQPLRKTLKLKIATLEGRGGIAREQQAVQQADARAQQAVQQADAWALQANARADQAEARARQAEARAQQVIASYNASLIGSASILVGEVARATATLVVDAVNEHEYICTAAGVAVVVAAGIAGSYMIADAQSAYAAAALAAEAAAARTLAVKVVSGVLGTLAFGGAVYNHFIRGGAPAQHNQA